MHLLTVSNQFLTKFNLDLYSAVSKHVCVDTTKKQMMSPNFPALILILMSQGQSL